MVTGSCRGIGKAIAKGLAAHGASVVEHGVSSIDACKKVALEIGNDASSVVCDLSDETCSETLYKQTGDIDILILNASVQYRKAWDEISGGEFDKQVRVNLKSSLELMQIYFRHMKEQKWGRIIAIGSVQQYKPHKDMMVYAATKSAQMNYVKNDAKQLGPFGFTVNNIAPGVIVTSRNEAALADLEYRKKYWRTYHWDMREVRMIVSVRLYCFARMRGGI